MSGTRPVSTLMPGMTPFSFAKSTIFFPSVVLWYRVSVNRMAPPQKSPRPLVPSSVWRQRWRFDSVFSTPMDSRRTPQVPFDSSIARMPFPGAVIALTVARSSSLNSAQCDQGSGEVPTFIDTRRWLFLALRAPERATAAKPMPVAAALDSAEAMDQLCLTDASVRGASRRDAPRRDEACGKAVGCTAEAKARVAMLPGRAEDRSRIV